MTSGRLTSLRCSDPAVTRSAAALWWLQHPASAPRPDRPFAGLRSAAWVLAHAPQRVVHLSPSGAGRHIDEYLGARRLGVPWRLSGRSVLDIPAPGEPLFSGRSLQAARTNMSRALAAGYHCREVEPSRRRPGEREFQVLDADGSCLGDCSVTPDRVWALMNWMEAWPAEANYLLHGHVVGELQRLGVRHLLITSGNIVRLKPGLVYLQARLGYEVVNLQLAPGAPPTCEDTGAGPSSRPRRASPETGRSPSPLLPSER